MTTINLEAVLHEFRTQRGLYILGAGASAADVPFGTELMTAPALDYVRNSWLFPVVVREKAALTERIVAEARRKPWALAYPTPEAGLEATDVSFYLDLFERLPDFHAWLHMKHALSTARFNRRRSANYRVFQFFSRGMIANYNHDGLASDICRRFHRVIEMHGTIEAGFGSPEMAEIVAEARGYDLSVPLDNLLTCVPESYYDLELTRRLAEVETFQPEVITVIGYSFGRRSNGFDDIVSLESFLRKFREFLGYVYVIDPSPYELQHMLADGLRCRNVLGIAAYWNVLAHTMIIKAMRPCWCTLLNYEHERILDRFGSNVSFARTLDSA